MKKILIGLLLTMTVAIAPAEAYGTLANIVVTSEPATMILVGLGISGLLILRVRAKK